MADAGKRGVGVTARVLGKQLVRGERAVGTPGDDIGERATAVDPELPAPGIGVRGHGPCHREDGEFYMLKSARPAARQAGSESRRYASQHTRTKPGWGDRTNPCRGGCWGPAAAGGALAPR